MNTGKALTLFVFFFIAIVFAMGVFSGIDSGEVKAMEKIIIQDTLPSDINQIFKRGRIHADCLESIQPYIMITWSTDKNINVFKVSTSSPLGRQLLDIKCGSMFIITKEEDVIRM